MKMSAADDSDINLQSTVMCALSKLQHRMIRGSRRPNRGVTCKNIAEFLKTNIPWMDGDIESQVMTALLSSVKAGLVCALEDRKYRLVKPISKNMVKNCETRVSHGTQCNCLQLLKNLGKTFIQPCCTIKERKKPSKKSGNAGKCGNSGGNGGKCGNAGKHGNSGKNGRKSKKISGLAKKTETACAQNAHSDMGTSRSNIVLQQIKHNGKCNYCLEIHSLPKLRKVCMTCYPLEPSESLHCDKFSPRDEQKC